MKKSKNTSRVFLWLALIFTLLTILISAFGAVVLSFNLWNITDNLSKLMVSYGYALDADAEIKYTIVSFIISIFVEIYFAIFYAKAIRYRANSPVFARRLMSKSFWQLIIGSLLPAIFAMISASIMAKQKQPTPASIINERNDMMAAYKLEAMTEAVERLKELKSKGAISEEEYYANLNRILEG